MNAINCLIEEKGLEKEQNRIKPVKLKRRRYCNTNKDKARCDGRSCHKGIGASRGKKTKVQSRTHPHRSWIRVASRVVESLVGRQRYQKDIVDTGRLQGKWQRRVGSWTGKAPNEGSASWKRTPHKLLAIRISLLSKAKRKTRVEENSMDENWYWIDGVCISIPLVSTSFRKTHL